MNRVKRMSDFITKTFNSAGFTNSVSHLVVFLGFSLLLIGWCFYEPIGLYKEDSIRR